ncbi:MAG: acyl carrier protein [Verrucomicrobiae bacterium]|nr:acyl carrier protein [Verrucomicrobiae bacterium]
MSENTLEARLHDLLSKVLGIPPGSISDDLSPDNTPEWSSIAHLNLILAIEDEFDIQLSPEETLEMLSVRLIRLYLEETGRI